MFFGQLSCSEIGPSESGLARKYRLMWSRCSNRCESVKNEVYARFNTYAEDLGVFGACVCHYQELLVDFSIFKQNTHVYDLMT